MQTPEININGKVYAAKPPKASYWRKMVQFDDKQQSIPDQDYLAAHAEMIAEAFNSKEVTSEAVLESLTIDEVRPKYLEIVKWIFGLVNSRLSKLPNQETPEQ